MPSSDRLSPAAPAASSPNDMAVQLNPLTSRDVDGGYVHSRPSPPHRVTEGPERWNLRPCRSCF